MNNETVVCKNIVTGVAETTTKGVAMPEQDILNLSVEEVADLILLKEKSVEAEETRRRIEIEERTVRCQALAQEVATLGMAGFLGDREVEDWKKTVGKKTGSSRGWRVTEGWMVVGDNGVIYTGQKRRPTVVTLVAAMINWVTGMVWLIGLNKPKIAGVFFGISLAMNVLHWLSGRQRFVSFNWEEDRSCLQTWLEKVKAEGLSEVAKARKTLGQGALKDLS